MTGKRFSFFILTALWTAALALLLALPAAAQAQASGVCGEGLSWELDADGSLTVSGSGAMSDYVAEGEPASPFAALGDAIRTVTLGDGVTSVGNAAFYACGGIESVTLPAELTRIGDGAFYGCRELTAFTAPDSLTEIGQRAFRGCSALTEILLPQGLTRIGDKAFADTAWYDAQPDGPVYLGTALLAYKGEMPRKTEITVAEGTLLIADGAFWACDRMISLTLPEGLRYIGESAFWTCGGITELRLPEGLLQIGDEAFYCCDQPETVELPRSLTSVGRAAFSGCRGLKRAFVPAGVTQIGPEAFPKETVIEGYEGSYAEQYAAQMGLTFTARMDEYAPETTTAPEGERAKAKRRKQIGTVAACVAAGVIGVSAAVGLIILRRKP